MSQGEEALFPPAALVSVADPSDVLEPSSPPPELLDSMACGNISVNVEAVVGSLMQVQTNCKSEADGPSGSSQRWQSLSGG